MKKKVLFLNADVADYLSISLLHGLKSLEDVEVIDYPVSEILYKKNRDKLQNKIRGKGFTLFFLIDEDERDRFHLYYNEIQNDYYDLIIFGDISAHFGLYVEMLPYLKKNKTVILDGSDSPSIYPYFGHFWRKPYYWFLPRAHNRFKYFKREITQRTVHYRWFKLIPESLCKYLPLPENVYPISFSIPEEKIVKELPPKTKLFPRHIVDGEVAENIEGSSTSYVFNNEEDYYKDLQSSKFGITTKRGGWDCMRHYEIAANGAVPCFKELDKKPKYCAPFGLDKTNSIIYLDYNDLVKKINLLDENGYKKLQSGALNWVKSNTTIEKAKELLAFFDQEGF